MENPTLTLSQFVAQMNQYLADHPEHAQRPMVFYENSYNADPTPFFDICEAGRYVWKDRKQVIEPALCFSGSYEPTQEEPEPYRCEHCGLLGGH